MADFISGSGAIKFWRTSDGALLASFDKPPRRQILCLLRQGRWLARRGLRVQSITRANSEIALRWQDGSGKYQVQARENLATGDWQNIGDVTTNTVFTHTCLSPLFYRVQSLPISP